MNFSVKRSHSKASTLQAAYMPAVTKIAFIVMKVPLQLADKFPCQSELLQCKDMS